MLRSAHKAMVDTASIILKNKRAFEAEAMCSTVKNIFRDVGFLEVKEKDIKYSKGKINVIIPAAGKELIFDIPKSMVKIKGKTILKRQIEILKKCGIQDITVVRGFKKELINIPEVKCVDNDEYEEYGLLYSLFRAEKAMGNGFIYVNSDILFDEQIINLLINSKKDIVLVVDNSYTYHKHEIDKQLDLVLTKKKISDERRTLYNQENQIIRIGKDIDKNMADYEFIGIAYFSEYGVEIIRKIFYDCKTNKKGCFQAMSVESASFNDFIQEVIDRGFIVNILEIHKGWIEIHNKQDLEVAERLI